MNKILIKMYYQQGIYNDKHLEVFVKSGDITEAEMKAMREVNRNG